MNVLLSFLIQIFCLFPQQNVGQGTPTNGVTFVTTDVPLQRMFDRAEELAKENIVMYGSKRVMIEGAQYRSVWLETQPMGGVMYAKRDIDIAKNNVEIFMEYQRSDGRFPGVIYNRDGKIVPNYCQFQGFYFPMPAFELYFILDHDTLFLKKLYAALEAFDSYLWRTRDSDGNGCLESWCIYDTGEDNCVRYNGFPNGWDFEYPPSPEIAKRLTKEELQIHCKQSFYDSTKKMVVPIESMDVMSYSYSCRDVLSLIAKELHNGKEKVWRTKAEEVKKKLKEYLWDDVKKACYDRDRENITMPILLHNNLRCMYFGSFDQEMADAFVKYHLMNPKEFFTPMPLPSIAVNDSAFCNLPDNNWSGQPQGLTFQRSIRALENYGHYAELTMIGKRFLQVIEDSMKFVQQFDPFTATPHGKDGYGPSILASLEFLSKLYGVGVVMDSVYWSCISGKEDYTYTQYWKGVRYTIEVKGGTADCSINDRVCFSFSRGARIVTDLNGKLIKVIGIDEMPNSIALRYLGQHNLLVEPNAVYRLFDDGQIEKVKAVTFARP